MDKLEIVKVFAWLTRGEPAEGEPVAANSLGEWGGIQFVKLPVRFGLYLGNMEIVTMKQEKTHAPDPS